MSENSHSILHIPSEKKKPSKKDGPLEKETRKFNRLVKEIEVLEKAYVIQQVEEEEYHRLFLQQVHPLLLGIAQAQVVFIEKLEAVFYAEKFAKNIEKRFVEFAIPVLQDAAAYLDVAKEKLENYLVWQSTLFSKGSVVSTVNDNVDAENNEHIKEEDQYQTNQWDKTAAAPDLDKKSVAELYKELAKQIHPDLEQNEELKYSKEQLMKELTAAKDKEDVYAMLLIRQKASMLNSDAPAENSYSLQLLKKYNQSLSKKLEGLKRALNKIVFESFHSKEDFLAEGKKKQPAAIRIKKQMKDLKELEENLQTNTRLISTGAHLKELLDL